MQETSTHDYLKMKAREKLLDGAGISVDRMPLLHVIFERMAGQCSENLRQLSASPALFLVESVITERIGDVLDGCESDVVFGILQVQAWDSRLLIGLEHDFVFSLVESLFGGDGGEAPLIDKRQLSNIELLLAKKAFELFARALQNSFASVCETVFKLDRIETKLDFVAIAPRTAFGVRTKLKLRILGRESNMFVLIPQTALNSIRQDLVRDLSAEMSVRDSAMDKADSQRNWPDRNRNPRGYRGASLLLGGYCMSKSRPSADVEGHAQDASHARMQRGASFLVRSRSSRWFLHTACRGFRESRAGAH
jgi:flagellar motor switch protein FliM